MRIFLEKKREGLFLLVFFVIACLLRFFQFSIFEFKNDQFAAIELGKATKQACFLVTHGIMSSINVYNPPLFTWFMGAVVYYTENPFYITLIFCLVNILALFLCLRYFLFRLPALYATIASSLVAFSPAFTIYSSNIWAQCLLPLPMILFYMNIHNLILYKKGLYFLWLAIIVSLACQLHLSGLYLYPVIFVLGFIYRKSIEKKFFVSAAFFTLIVFSPYIYYLLFKCGIRSLPNLMRHATIMTRFDIFIEHLGMSSFDFFRYYFGGDFNMILAKVAGPFRFVLYPFSCLLMVFFAIGSFLYLRWIIKTKRFFSEDKEEVKNCPVVFQIAGFITLLVTLGYMFSLPRVYPHYLIILFPAQAIIAGFAANRLWLLPGARVIIIGAILSTLLLLCGTLIFLKGSGGHPREYGPNYSLLVDLKKEVWGRVPRGYCPEPSIHFSGLDKSDSATVRFFIMNGHKCEQTDQRMPLRVLLYWDKQLMRYNFFVL